MSSSFKHSLRRWQKTLFARYARLQHRLAAPKTRAAPAIAWTRFQFGNAQPNNAPIPKIIWAFWTGSELPLLVRECYENWKRFNPDYAFHLLSDATLSDYLTDIPAELSRNPPEKRADWARVALLKQYGGIWLDSSILLSQPLDWVMREHEKHHADFVGFYLRRFTHEPNIPVVENWFMAAPPGSPFLQDLYTRFTEEIIKRSAQEYVSALQKDGILSKIIQGIDDPFYLSMHVAIQHLLHESHAYTLALAPAEEGPFHYQEQAGWKRRILHRLIFFQHAQQPFPIFVKIRGGDRRDMDTFVHGRLYVDDSVYARLTTTKSPSQ